MSAFSRRKASRTQANEYDRLVEDGADKVARANASNTSLWAVSIATFAIVVAAVTVGSIALHRLDSGFTTPSVTTPLLFADNASLGGVVATNFTSVEFTATNFVAENTTTETFSATNASVTNLVADNTTTVTFSATNASVTNLSVDMLSSSILVHQSSGVIPATHNKHVLRNDPLAPAPITALEMTFPADVSAYAGKEVQICSADSNSHSLSLTSPATFDARGFWGQLVFIGDGVSSCCVTLSFGTASASPSVVSRDPCTIFCNNPNHCVDPERPEATNPLHGWWRKETKTLTFRSYGYLDTTVVPMEFAFNSFGPLTYRIERPSPDVVRLYAVGNGILNTQQSLNLYNPDFTAPWYQVQPGLSQMIGSGFGIGARNIEYGNMVNGGLYVKVKDVPPLAPASSPTLDGTSLEEPQEILRRLFQIFVQQAYTTQENESNEAWTGYAVAKASMDKIISTGVSYSNIAIIRTQTTHALNPEGLTQFRTAEYHHVSPIGYVTVSGFTGACTVLNGIHLVSAQTTTNNAETDPLFQDYGPNPLARTVHHEVGIHFDSSAIPVIPGTNIADCTGSTPVLSVSYGPIDAGTNYVNTLGALYHWFYENVKVALHFWPSVYFDAASLSGPFGIALPRIEWSDVAADISAGTAFTAFVVTRVTGSNTQLTSNPTAPLLWWALFGDTLTSRLLIRWTDLMGPFGLRPDLEILPVFFSDSTERGTFWYHTALENYLQNASYPAWKMVGTSRSHRFNLVAQFLYPGGGGDEFDTIMVPVGEIPPADYSYTESVFFQTLNGGSTGYTYDQEWNFVNELRQQAFFVARIDPALTGGVNVGYMRVAHIIMYDPFSLMNFAYFCPTGLCNITSPRNNGEAAASVYATYMRYLLVDLECEHVIIDIRGNLGGTGTQQPLMASFFGSGDYNTLDRAFGAKAGNGYGESYDMKTFRFPESILDAAINSQRIIPDLSETNYPGSVLTGGNVIILDDLDAISAGDVFPNHFLGPALDGQLGSNTNMSMIGAVDGRLSGYRCTYGLPTGPPGSSLLRNAAGNPVTPLLIGLDCGSTARRSDGTSLGNRHPGLEIDPSPTLSGLSGSNALPQDLEELIYKDMGFTTNTRPRIAGDTRPQTASVITETNPLSTVAGSNVVTVTTTAAHGFTTGDSVALGGGADPVATTSGIPGGALTGGHVITVTGANTFTFEATGDSDYSCYPRTDCRSATPADTTATGVGGTIRIMNRSQWRDAWLEQAILKAIATPAKKKKRTPSKLAPKKKQSVVGKFDPEQARRMHGRNVVCPSGVNVTHVQSMNATRTIVVDLSKFDIEDPARQQAIQAARQQVSKSIAAELADGGMCLDEQGALMATPTCKEMIGIKFSHGKNSLLEGGRAASASKKRQMLQHKVKK
jgi:hypothetical protein